MFQEKYLCLGRKIAELRKQKGLSQKEFADLIGISASYLAKLECARGIRGISLEILFTIAKGLDVSCDQLLRVTKVDKQLVTMYQLQRNHNKQRKEEKSKKKSHHQLSKRFL